MRPLEILTPIILAIYLLWPITGRKRPPAIGILPAFALVIIAAHANIEGMRWQMYPPLWICNCDIIDEHPGLYESQARGCTNKPAASYPCRPGVARHFDGLTDPPTCSFNSHTKWTLSSGHDDLRTHR